MVELPQTDPALARLATVRHNQARGTRDVLGMADIVADLLEFGLTPHEISRRLGMDDEEVDRLADRGDMPKRDTVTGFRTVESFEHSDPAIARLVRVGYSTVES